MAVLCTVVYLITVSPCIGLPFNEHNVDPDLHIMTLE